ncbi:3-oxoacyl-ACP reductase [Rhizocola hellebori]|uniref:3-oxoacyl-ACP reductase n=1 Tax=Rhizocola hellebori TaxID=1392758 RepID=A0A8J3VCX8_9ACTN|nr:SDR family oxidoreductase [Rhizocola hellebori]GIH03009.1 3-oxoacyl-ACP reductase [Rhizocola hellebori]
MGNRTALITGSSRGIGLQIARHLAAEGFALTMSARNEPGLADAALTLRADGAQVLAVPANLAVEDDVRRLAAAHGDHYGGMDLLVLNGGVAAQHPVADTPMKTYDLLLNVNLRAQFVLVQAALPLLRHTAAERPRHGAKIVALSSITGKVSEPGLAAYAASKAGLISLCETITLEESGAGVTATAICPGYVDTDMTALKKQTLAAEAMLSTRDVAELVMAVSRLSAHAVVPSMVLTRAGNPLWRA